MTELNEVRRPGGRASNSIRPLSCELSCLQNSDGSAQFSAGSTSALASVHGPVAPRLPQHENPGGAVVSVIVKSPSSSTTATSSSLNRTYELEWEQIVSQVLTRAIVTELYPRTVIQVVVQITAMDGSVLSVVLHAAVSAIMDAGIDLHYLPTVATCLCVPTSLSMKNPVILLDPSAEEEQGKDSGMVVVVTQSGDDESVLAIHTSNACLSARSLLQCCQLAHRTSPAIVAFWRLVVEQKAAREAQTLWSGATTS